MLHKKLQNHFINLIQIKHPLSVFSQSVHGINFKYVFASLDVYGVVTVLTTTIYLDPENNAQFKSAVVAEEFSKVSMFKKIKIVKEIEKVYKSVFNDSRIITEFKNILFEDAGDSLYFVKINENDYAFVYEDSKRKYNVDYIVKDFNMLYKNIK